MQIGKNSRKRPLWWCWPLIGLAATFALPGTTIVSACGVKAAGAGTDGQHAIEGGARSSQMPVAADEATQPAKDDRLPAESEIVTVRVANSVERLRPGQRVEILTAEMPTVNEDEVLKALTLEGGGWPFMAETARDNARIAVETVAVSLGETRFYPMVGPARHYRCYFQCTVRSNRVIRSDWPVPFLHTESVEERVHIDHDHLIAEDANTKDRSDDVFIEKVRLVSAVPQKRNGDAHEVRLAALPEQARRLREAAAHGRLLVVFGEDAKRSREVAITNPVRHNLLSAILIEGNRSIRSADILKCIGTRRGRIFNRQQLRDDLRVLMAKRWFHSVEARMGESSDGPVLIFHVVERPAEERTAVPVEP